jgi:hypothetical protein
MTRQVKWAILITPFEQEGTEYVREGCGAMWTQDSPVKVFDTYQDAKMEWAKWNTAEIVQYPNPDEDFVLYKDWTPKEQKDE